MKKAPAVTLTPTKACKRPRVEDAGLVKVSEVRAKEAEVADEEELWGRRACEELTRLSGSLDGLTAMVERQTLILGRLVGMMEEESDQRRSRRRREGTPRVALTILGGDEEEEVREEVEEEARNEGENEEDGE